MRDVLRKLNSLLFVAVVFGGCGTRPPPQEVLPPSLSLPRAGTCPGALPGANIQISTAIGESSAPVVAWTGDEFVIAWWDLRGRFPELWTIALDRSGRAPSPPGRIPYPGAARDQSIAWDGREIHLAFADGDKVISHRLGKPEGGTSIISERGKMPAAGAYGAVAWVADGNLWFLSDAMTPLPSRKTKKDAPSPVVIATGGIETPQVVFNGRFYAVVWSSSIRGGREILFRRVSPKGRLLGDVVQVSHAAGISRKPTVALAGHDFAVAWTHGAPAEDNPRDRFRVFLALIPEEGAQPKMTRQLDFRGSADQVALAATGQEFGLSWVGSREPVGSAVYFQRMGLDGEPIEGTIEITDGVPLTCGPPNLVWDGEGYGVVWHDDRARTGAEVFFAHVDCDQELPQMDFSTQAQAGESPELSTDSERDGGVQAPLPRLKDVF